ncbi:hypothetical protein [Borrelia sp. P9F1]|uniref:hypothetical protein n=1 Tax=Borrelia sp. P9F1 TaxID=3058374 RepID=UPI0026471AA5|nr:hypothetical protein [Borrelia sp. P9F1]WKC58571.1 hypothetical protein QYZ68_05060 [Borrelia sp. P9F1]
MGYLYFKEFEVGQMHSYFTICADSGITMSNDDKGRIIEELILESLVYPFQATSVSEIRNYLFKESPQMALVLLMFLTQKNRDIRKCSQVSYAVS